jgi:hypothetical protein
MIGSSESWVLNRTHIFGTHVPVEEPSTASIADMLGLNPLHCAMRHGLPQVVAYED